MKKFFIKDIIDYKRRGEKFSTITAYDYLSSKLVSSSGFPLVLVGDSASMVVFGYNDTTPISMDEMVFILRAVVRGSSGPVIVADMPFMSYQPSLEEAIKNAGTFIKEGANAVKVEGADSPTLNKIRHFVSSGIPVVGHIGLMPQSINITSGYSVQGKTRAHAKKLIKDAINLEDAGIFCLVLEGVPAQVAELITKKIRVPTIGIGSGPSCDGQIQVFHDLMGLDKNFLPKHAKKFLDGFEALSSALKEYANSVADGSFPSNENYTCIENSILKNISEDN